MSKLLLVDDDANTLASLARAFRLAGHEAVVCDNADRALDLAKTHRFDMILSDVVMPGKDGLTLLAELRTAGIQTPVVMVSGQANIEMAVRATRLGAIDFLEKPLSTEKLLMTVENTVKLSRLEDENRRLKQRAGRQELVWKSAVMQGVISNYDTDLIRPIIEYAADVFGVTPGTDTRVDTALRIAAAHARAWSGRAGWAVLAAAFSASSQAHRATMAHVDSVAATPRPFAKLAASRPSRSGDRPRRSRTSAPCRGARPPSPAARSRPRSGRAHPGTCRAPSRSAYA